MSIYIDIVEDFCNDKMKTPEYAHIGDSGVDLQANTEEAIVLSFGERKLIPTGIYLGIPKTPEKDFNWEIQIRSRSGLAHKKGVIVLNSPGTIDSIYRGQIFVNILNAGVDKFHIEPGDKIAQAVLAKAYDMFFVKTNSLDNTSRGDNGHGSTDE